MTQEDYLNIHELTYVGGGYMPYNDKAKEYSDQLSKGEIIPFKEAKMRDIRFHRCYFALLNFIYAYLPTKFKKQVSEKDFYKWLKHLKGEYTECYTFNDGTKMIEYDSISFGRMNQKAFEEYVKLQLPWIYENVIGAFYEGDIYTNIVETIEQEFERFLIKLK